MASMFSMLRLQDSCQLSFRAQVTGWAGI